MCNATAVWSVGSWNVSAHVGQVEAFDGYLSLGRMHRGCDVAPMLVCLVQCAQAWPPCSSTQGLPAEAQQDLHQITNAQIEA